VNLSKNDNVLERKRGRSREINVSIRVDKNPAWYEEGLVVGEQGSTWTYSLSMAC